MPSAVTPDRAQPLVIELEYFTGEVELLIGVEAEDFLASLPSFTRFMIAVTNEVETANDDRLKRIRILAEDDWSYIEMKIKEHNA